MKLVKATEQDFQSTVFGNIYVVFLILFAITGVISTYITSNKIVLQICVTVCSWTSFFRVDVHVKRLMPGMKRSEFIKGLFAERINWKLIGIIIIIQQSLFRTRIYELLIKSKLKIPSKQYERIF